MILQCTHITKTFLTDIILNDISFHINDNEKAAIVGINGSGKSTLIKIIMNELEADSGEVIISKDISIGYFAQNQEYNSNKSILEEMHGARPEVEELGRRLDELSAQMDNTKDEKLEALIKQYDQARHRFEQLGGYSYESEITGVLKGLGFNEEDFGQPVQSLSGGEKTRVALAMMLLKNPDLVILDEPANHLDMNSIQWLEGYLANYKGAVLVVAHDRYFLDKIATKIIELRQAKCSVFQGNYTEYSRKKQAAMETLMKQYLNQQAEIKHQEEVIAKLKSFNREKSIKRAESREKMLDKIERIDKPVEEKTKMNLLFKPRIQSGNDVLSVKGLSKSYGSHQLFSDISFEIKRGEHVAIIGDNGTGKTTILKMLMEMYGTGTDFDGQIKFGTNVHIAYYDQEHQVLHPEKTLFEEIQDTYPDMNNTQVRNVLAAFLFTNDDVFKQVKNLSGGERGRVSLAKLMLSDANFLLLDEPTNHLDIDSKEILEHAINNFEGTILYVSHDRYFINTTASRILNLTQQQIVNYPGNYDYYLEKKEDAERAQLSMPVQVVSCNPENSFASGNKTSWQQQKEEQARLRKIENELKKTETEIEKLETRNTEIDLQLSDPANGTNIQLLQELSKEHEANRNRLEELMEQWEALSDKL
ncbi:MAG: ABC-F family ATP-binding cassette domain-containing protein [Lachnospiraceae bacterium]|nr:ABC-F family ATP-binding cassette domain-containing protein [Lachnospiraceae bacterium]